MSQIYATIRRLGVIGLVWWLLLLLQRAHTRNTSLSAKQAPSQCSAGRRCGVPVGQVVSPCNLQRCHHGYSTDHVVRGGRYVLHTASRSSERLLQCWCYICICGWSVPWMAQIQAPSRIKHAEILKLHLLCPNSTVCCKERQIAHKRASVSDWPQRSVLPNPSNISMCSIPNYWCAEPREVYI